MSGVSAALTSAINLSEGRDDAILERLAEAAGEDLLDLNADPYHHRCVLTLGPQAEQAARRVAATAVELIDLRRHTGVHPRLGVVDVVPFTPFPPVVQAGATAVPAPAELRGAVAARDAFPRWASRSLGVPCFLYGPERSLPEVRRLAFSSLAPDNGPDTPDPGRGACCVGARPALVAYNVVLQRADLALARRIASQLRSPQLRTLGLPAGGEVQISCNLLEPVELGPAEVTDLVAAHSPVARCELVGLVPAAVLARVPPERWRELDLGPERTLEGRLAAAGGRGRSGLGRRMRRVR